MPIAILYECFFCELLVDGQRRTLVTGQFTFRRNGILFDMTLKARLPEDADMEATHNTMRAMVEQAALAP